MDTLEELLRAACERGITHLTLYPVPSSDGRMTYWNARGTPSTGHKYVSVASPDPVEALRGVLLGLPKATKRSPKEVTAAVTPALPEPSEFFEHSGSINSHIDQWLPKT